MVKIVYKDDLEHKVNEVQTKEELRPYLGLSQIGSCHRYLQYYHYWAFESHLTSRIQRLFQTGNLMEHLLVDELERLGIEYGSDQAEVIGTAGHWKGHIDGEGFFEGDTFLIEFKTHNDKFFKILKKKKVKEGFKKHYGQMQSYMGHRGLKLGLYVAINKNDSTIYFEWIVFDEEYFKESQRKELEIIASDTLLPRIGNNSKSWFECKMCDARHVCFNTKDVERSCRTCKSVDVLPKGKWECTYHNESLNTMSQRVGCGDYETAPMFKE